MKYDFDKIVDRYNTDSLKYDFARKRRKPEDILPLWVADMDFPVPPEVTQALVEKSEHGIFGYSDSRDDYMAVLIDWFKLYFDWDIDPKWLVKTPGVVYAVTTAINAFTNMGDSVLIQEPVYYPFSEAIRLNKRKLVVNQLVYNNGTYEIDFDDFEKKIKSEEVKVFILCSPHNPVGRVWKRDELIKMGEICKDNGVIVIADEIHADFVYPEHKHEVFVNLRDDFKDFTVTCTAPSKTFNLAGLQISNNFISNKNLKMKFKETMAKSGYSQPNIMGIVSCKAAYEFGHEWLKELKDYLLENLNFTREFLREKFPEIKLVEPEGTYLIWLDCSALGLTDKELEERIVNKAGLWLDSGTMFGAGGSGFQRINIACPRKTLEEALNRLLLIK